MKIVKLCALTLLVTITNLMGNSQIPWHEKVSTAEYAKWIEGQKQNAKIYLPSVEDYKVLKTLLEGSGFGPGNGGNEYLFEVDKLAKDLMEYIGNHQEKFPEIDLNVFEQTLANTAVFFIQGLPANKNQFVQALNWQKQKLILLEKQSWERLDLEMKYRLLFHEYLGVVGLEINNAFISSRFSLSEYFSNQQRFEVNWEKIKLVYSNANTTEYALKLDLEKTTNRGILTTSRGQTEVHWTKRGESLHLKTLEKTIKSIHFPVVDTPSHGMITVEAERTLLEMSLRKITRNSFETRSIVSECLIYPQYLKLKDTCSINEIIQNQSLLAIENLKHLDINLKNGDLFVLPLRETTSRIGLSSTTDVILTQLTREKTNVVFKSNHRKDHIKAWSISDGVLELIMDTNSKYKIKLIKNLRGTDRALIEYTDANKNYVYVGPFFQIKKNSLPTLNSKNFAGEYLPIYANSSHTSEEYIPYSFNSDGFGGFTQMNPDFTYFWKWEIKNNRVYATRKIHLDENGYFSNYVLDKKSYEACTPPSCAIFQEREYLIIKSNKHRFTMLRKMQMHYPSSDEKGNMFFETTSYSADLWVMDKI